MTDTKPIYHKKLRTGIAFENELRIYQSDFPHKAELLGIKDDYVLILSKVDGIPYLDAAENDKVMIPALAKVVGDFHKLSDMPDKAFCHWDNQPRNILWSETEQKIYLLDFEDSRIDHAECDIAHLMLFWASVMNYDRFCRAIGLFFSAYRGKYVLDQSFWDMAYQNAINRFDSRRAKYHKTEKTYNPDMADNRNFLMLYQF